MTPQAILGEEKAPVRRLPQPLRNEDLNRLVAGITLPNDASVALHRRFGFTQAGLFTAVGREFGRYRDVMWPKRPLPIVNSDESRPA